jgi:PKD repeat protein
MSISLNSIKNKIVLVFIIQSLNTFSQNLNWPLEPFQQQHRIAGTTGEYRVNSRFHQGVDIHDVGLQDVHAILGGSIVTIGGSGSSSYLIIESEGGVIIKYQHISIRDDLEANLQVQAGELIGTMYSWNSPHLHLESEQFNFLDQKLYPFDDNTNLSPTISYPSPGNYTNKYFFKNGVNRLSGSPVAYPFLPNSTQQFVFGKADIAANIYSHRITALGGYETGHVAPYIISYQIGNNEGNTSGEVVNYQFNYVPDDQDANTCFFPGSNNSNFNYILTTRPNHAEPSFPDFPVDRYFNAKVKAGVVENAWDAQGALSDAVTYNQAHFPDGEYTLTLRAKNADDDGILQNSIGIQQIPFRIDNFRPYVEEVQVFENNSGSTSPVMLYNGAWKFNQYTLYLDPFQLGTENSIGLENVRLKEYYHHGNTATIAITFSEPIPNTPDNPRVRLRCGATYSTLTSINSTLVVGSDSKTFYYQIPSATLTALAQSPDREFNIEIEAKDFTGADLLGFEPDQTATNFLLGNNLFNHGQIPYREWQGSQIEWFRNERFLGKTIDKSHLFKRITPCSGGILIDGGASSCPSADFVANTTSIVAGESVVFTNHSENLNNGFTWNFGDGNFGSTNTITQTITHTYNAIGDFSVVLSGNGVTQNGVTPFTRQRMAYIHVEAPEITSGGGSGQAIDELQADFNFYPSSPYASEAVSFEFLGSGGVPPYQYHWTFQNGNPISSTSENPETTFSSSGNGKAVTLVVSDYVGQTATHTEYINVLENVPPLDFQTVPGQECMTLVPNTGNQFTLNQMVSFHPASVNIATQFLTYQWDFGDGNYSNEYSPVHHYTTEGNYLVNLTISGGNSGTIYCSQQVQVSNQYQISGLSVQSTNGITRHLVNGTASSFNLEANYNGATVSTPNIFYWTFTPQDLEQLQLSVQTTGNTLTQQVGLFPTVLTPGTWDVEVTACNSQGCVTSLNEDYLIVSNDPPATESGPMVFTPLSFLSSCYSPDDGYNYRVGFELLINVLPETYGEANQQNRQCWCTDNVYGNGATVITGPHIGFLPLQWDQGYSFENTVGPGMLLDSWPLYVNATCQRNRGSARVLLDDINTTVFPKLIEGRIEAAACDQDGFYGDPATVINREFSFEMYKCLRASDIAMPSVVNLCPGSSYSLQAVNNNKARPPFTYQWFSNSPNAMNYISDPHTLNPEFNFPSNVTGDFVYTLRINSGDMGSTISQYYSISKSLTFQIQPISVQIPQAEYRVCLGNPIQIQANSIGGEAANNNYLWLSNLETNSTNPPNFTPALNLNDPNIRNPIFQANANGTYELVVFVSSGQGTCSSIGNVTITVDDQVSPVSAGENITTCPGKTIGLDGELENNAIGPFYQYRWYPSGNQGGEFNMCYSLNTNGLSYFSYTTVAPYQTTAYTLQTLQPNGCSAFDEIIVFVDETQRPEVSLPEDQLVCFGDEPILLELDIYTEFPPYEIEWWRRVNDQSSQLFASNQSAIPLTHNAIYNSNFPQAHQMEFIVDVVDANGCHFRNIDDPILLTANSKISVGSNDGYSGHFYRDGIFPSNYLETWGATGGTPEYTYAWELNGLPYSNSSTLNPDPWNPGRYILKVTDAVGCKASSKPFDINFYEKNPHPYIGELIQSCQNNTFYLFVQPYIPVEGNPELGLYGLVVNQSQFQDPIQNFTAASGISPMGSGFILQSSAIGLQSISFQFVFRDWYPGGFIFSPNSSYAFSIPVEILPSVNVTEPMLNACTNITTADEEANTLWAQQIFACPTGPVEVASLAIGRYYAGEFIKLLPGFKAAHYSDFIADLTCVNTLVQRLELTNASDSLPAEAAAPTGDQFQYFPNPTTGTLHINLSLTFEKEFAMDVLDLSGRNIKKVCHGFGKGHAGLLDLSELPAGSYCLKLSIPNSSLDQKVFKIIKIN